MSRVVLSPAFCRALQDDVDFQGFVRACAVLPGVASPLPDELVPEPRLLNAAAVIQNMTALFYLVHITVLP